MFEFVVDFEHNFNKEGQQLTSSISYTKDTDDIKNTISNTNSAFTNQVYTEKNKLERTAFEINFVSPISKTSTYTL